MSFITSNGYLNAIWSVFNLAKQRDNCIAFSLGFISQPKTKHDRATVYTHDARNHLDYPYYF